ncbi:hypothetical protein CPT_Sansa80 [Caulobacter phage Sansa]|uniref:Gene product 88 domain-containing protein n=1 Tax=Caulobacter phage Sansa TaxID=1675600 RepID=A0A0K1LM03_9CAUD|nr:hypothetical protein HOR07_gp080 [Caulobacter phage Sansa]AKU43484.1 hypothetical protein CPT_Sansa80 [Caulobacter phage Sansa]
MVAKNKEGRSTVLDQYRPAHALLTVQTAKTVKGEDLGYASAIMYLQPHTLVSEKSLCPHSSPACRAACLAGAGMNDLPRQVNARTERTRLFVEDRDAFMGKLTTQILDLMAVSTQAGKSLAVRLNGTSDILWERIQTPMGLNIFDLFGNVRFYDYTKIPIHKRDVPANVHLTFSLDEENFDQAVAYLRAGQSVAAVVPAEEKLEDGAWFALGDQQVNVVDGDLHDLRFLDPPGSLVMLKPKGNHIAGTELIQRGLVRRLIMAGRSAA